MKNTVRFLSQTFDHSRIASAQATLDVDLSGRSLDVDTARVSLSTQDRRLPMAFYTFEPLPFYTRDRKRFYTALTGEAAPTIGAWSQANALLISRGGSPMATFFPSSLRRISTDRTEVTAMSALGLLAQMSHKGGIYTGQTTAGDLIREICGSIPVYVSPVFESVLIYGFLPYVSPSGVSGAQQGSAKDNLLQVLFALNASVRAGSDGTLRVENLSTATVSVLDRSKIYRDGATVEELPPVTSVTVLEHNYAVGTAVKELFTGVTTAGQVIIFSEPCSSLVATGFTITESGANYAIVSAGSGTLTGKPYVHTTREITRTVSQSATENVMRVEGATLVGITNSSDVANRLAAFYACRKYVVCDAVLGFEDAGSVVSIYDPIMKQQVDACIESIAPLTFSNTLKGHVRALVGFTPWQTIPFTDEHVIIDAAWIAEHGSIYTFPLDIEEGTDVQVILISGGQAGTNGGSGSSGGGSYKSGTIHPGETVNSPAGSGGSGGAAGVKGVGGSIYRAALTVDPVDSFTVSVGAGGASNGALGSASTFGTLSSADGSPGGYFDPVTQTQYGKDGVDGVAGAKGGNGGSASGTNGSAGGAGGNVGTYNGGSGGAGWGRRGIYSDMTEALGGGGGGGAAHGANGSGGGNASSTAGSNRGGNGGAGAAAALAAHCGDGGSGGNGGGGGGGGGAWAYHHDSTSPASAYSYAAAGGSGGAGSAGSAGADGCVILIFRKPAQNNE